MARVKLLDDKSPLPLYYQLKVLMKDRFENGEWYPGVKIPSEKELADFYSTSVTTVRQAVSLLVNEGLLIRKQGKGTFVAVRKIQRGPKTLMSFTEEMRQKGLEVSSKILRAGRAKPNAGIRKILELPEDGEIFFIQRLRYANDQAIGLQSSYVVLNTFENLDIDEFAGSIYELLEKKYGITIASAEDNYSAVLLDSNTERLLGLHQPAVAFSVKRIAYSSLGKPVEYTESYMRADKYSLSISLERDGKTSLR